MDALAAATATRWIDLSLIDLPKNARPHRPEDLESLAQDMAKEGQLQEIVVMAHGDRFEVVAGVGRTLAAQKLKWDKIRCFVKDSLTEFDRLHITFSENEEREDASPLYQGQLLGMMLESSQGKQDELAAKLGKSQQTISDYIAISKLDSKVQDFTARAVNLKLKHLLQLLRLKTAEEQLALAKEASEKDLSVKALKAAVDKKITSAPAPSSKKPGNEAPSPGNSSFHFTRKGAGFAMTAFYHPVGRSIDDFFADLHQAFHAWIAKGSGSKKDAASAPAKTPIAPSSIRLAETPEEEAELQALATGSDNPAALYAWVYGKDSPITRSAGKATWDDMRPSDPYEFVKRFFKKNQ